MLFLACHSFGQKGVTTFGIQYKPIIPNRFIGTFEEDFSVNQFQSSIKQKWGHSFGMVVRHGFTKNISFETGINYTMRNFSLNYAVPDSGLAAQDGLTVVSYEVPLSGLIYIQLSDELFMNTSIGTSISMYASDVHVSIPIGGGDQFTNEGAYRSKFQANLIANYGFEFRTKKSGYFYLGASYCQPFKPFMTFAMAYEYEGGKQLVVDNVQGSYLTIDFRYFFNEQPKRD